MKPYDYQKRKGIREISWEDFKSLTKDLAKRIPPEVEAIIGVARGRLYPATFISHLLQKELLPVRISRRINDIVTLEHPNRSSSSTLSIKKQWSHLPNKYT